MRVVSYVRVSREEQVEGWSLDAQRDQCADLACAGYLRHPDKILPLRSPLVVMMQTSQDRNASESR